MNDDADHERSDAGSEFSSQADDMDSTDDQGRRDQILDAAVDVFAAEGFRGATIKRIAQRAKLRSQALIYWYFPTKEALFEAAIGRHLPILQLLLDPQTLMERPPEEVLPQFAHAYLAMGDQPATRRMVRLILPEAMRRPEVIELVGEPIIARVFDVIKRYLAHQVELGRLRPHDVRASARAFVGMLLPQLGGKLFFPVLQADGLTDEEHIAEIVAIFLRGLQPEEHGTEDRTSGRRSQDV